MSDLKRRNLYGGATAFAVILAMLGVTAYSPTLYDLFCRVTGYGGTTGVGAPAAAGTPADAPPVEVAFNADVNPDLPWRFAPEQRRVTVRPGENKLAFYTAENLSDRPVVARAIYNVTPHKVGYYFDKIHCFCFDEQTLQPGERVEMPVSFVVDPEMLDDPSTRDVRQITLSYTFFIDEEATAALNASKADTPHEGS